ncbi:MAG: hypothetical protein KME15_21600 [Drouetiella hepatica Uher 2000/2452]|jgi:hypothetical protein|uniref:Uncharacterized protein n=1 Tax=Drouetiella hepatica Uher 2000/2452 TaxID=904376 RepID=A0A951QE83_9CYAN|nr:hypothetical protein [Drouetiella hepatica Uher 2000/2452]
MVTPVIVMNLLIALFCLYAARKVWRLSKNLAIAADALVRAEESTHAVLSGAPAAISRGQVGTQELRQQYRQLELQIHQAQKILALTGLSQFVWRWYTRRRIGRLPNSQVVKPRLSRKSRRLG